MMQDTIHQIKDRVTVTDVMSKYGFETNRKGFMKCPFHSEKTPSFSVYADGKKFYCFGCGESGSCIDFVMKLFSINLGQAILRIDNDFGLGLSSTKPDLRESKKWKQEQQKKRNEKNALYAQRKRLISEHKRLWNNYLNFRPKSIDELPRAEFVESLHRLEYIRYLIDEIDRKGAEHYGRN